MSIETNSNDLSDLELSQIESGEKCYAGPLTANAKCIVITTLAALAYWYLPKNNKWVLISIIYFTYLAIAWYDWLYEAKGSFGPTYLKHFYYMFKPHSSKQSILYKNLCKQHKSSILSVDIIIAILLILLIRPFLRWKPDIT